MAKTSTNRPLIVVPGDHPVQIDGSPHLERLAPHGEVIVHGDAPATDEEKIHRATGATALINSRGTVKWPGAVLRELPGLRFITTCGIGTDAIDLETARELGIVVSNIPGQTAEVVAEHALALLLATAKRSSFQTAELRAGRWTPMAAIFLRGKTLGIVGTGSIGACVARLGRAIGMDVVAWTFHPSTKRADELGVRYVDLDELLRISDAVSVHVKLTPKSRGLIGEREIGLMKPGSLLLNTARGPIVDRGAMVRALQSGHLGGAGLDVFDAEPLPADDPILRCQQVVLTPHSADGTPEGIDLLNRGAVDNAIAFFEGKPRNVVTE